MEQGRLLTISLFDKLTKRVTELTAETRNELMIDLADNITVDYTSAGRQLEKLLTSTTSKQINTIQ